MDIRVIDNSARQRFEIHADGEVVGHAHYDRHGDELAVPHTEIEPQHRGRGLATALAEGIVARARERGLRILPYCPFLREYFAQHTDAVDVVPADRRAEFSLGGQPG